MTERPERRRYPRRKPSKQLLVVWKLGSQKYVSTVENLGLGGLFIRTENPPRGACVGCRPELLSRRRHGRVHRFDGPRAPHAAGPLAAQALSARGIAHRVYLKRDSTLTQAQREARYSNLSRDRGCPPVEPV